MRGTVPPIKPLPAPNLQLNALVINRVYDRFMTVFDVILWNLAFMFNLHFLFKEIKGEHASGMRAAPFVLLILKDASLP